MILSGNRIIKEVKEGNITIDPFVEEHVGPNSVDLRLSNKVLSYEKDRVLDMRRKPKSVSLTIYENGFLLEPGRLYLASTMEFTRTDKFVPMLEGRSSIGRLGLFIHVTAGFGDCGFSGHWTLELMTIHPIIIYPYERVCQIYYHEVDPGGPLYQGKYLNSDDKPVGSRAYLDRRDDGNF